MMIQATDKEAKIMNMLNSATDDEKKIKLLNELSKIHKEEMKKYKDIDFAH